MSIHPNDLFIQTSCMCLKLLKTPPYPFLQRKDHYWKCVKRDYCQVKKICKFALPYRLKEAQNIRLGPVTWKAPYSFVDIIVQKL